MDIVEILDLAPNKTVVACPVSGSLLSKRQARRFKLGREQALARSERLKTDKGEAKAVNEIDPEMKAHLLAQRKRQLFKAHHSLDVDPTTIDSLIAISDDHLAGLKWTFIR